MKKLLTVSLIVAVALALGGLDTVKADQVYLDNSGIDIQKWTTGNPLGQTSSWTDNLGDDFQTYGAKIVVTTDITLKLYTKFGGANASATGVGITVYPADLFLDVDPANNPGYDFAIRLRQSGQGNVYAISDQTNDINTSEEIMTGSTSGYYFGGRFDPNNVSPVPVEATVGNTSATTSVSWQYGNFSLGSLSLTNVWEVSIIISGLTGIGFDPGQDFAFVWGTATCGNDVIGGTGAGFVPIPLPPSVLLLGSGLVGLGLLGFRRRKRNI